jgi:hypothetical protein
LLKRKEAEIRRGYLQVGILASTVANFSLCHPDKPLAPIDFVPGESSKEKTDLTQLTPQQQRDYLMGMFFKRDMRVKKRGK